MASITKSPSNASSVSSSPLYNNMVWNNPRYVYAADGNKAYIETPKELNSKNSCLLRARGFGFNIPSDAEILGIKLDAALSEVTTGQHRDCYVRLSNKNGTMVGDNKATDTYLGPFSGYTSWGGDSDTWGSQLSVSDINSSNFGINLSFYVVFATSTSYLYIDHIRITVYYAENNVTIDAPACSKTVSADAPTIKKVLTAPAAQAGASMDNPAGLIALPLAAAGIGLISDTHLLKNIADVNVAGVSLAAPAPGAGWSVNAQAGAASGGMDLPGAAFYAQAGAGECVCGIPVPEIYCYSSIEPAGMGASADPPTVSMVAPVQAAGGAAIDFLLPALQYLAQTESAGLSLSSEQPDMFLMLRADSGNLALEFPEPYLEYSGALVVYASTGNIICNMPALSAGQVLSVQIGNLAASADAHVPAFILYSPAGGISANFNVPSFASLAAVAPGNLLITAPVPGIRYVINAALGNMVLECVPPAAAAYDILIRAQAAIMYCAGLHPTLLCGGWTRVEYEAAAAWKRDEVAEGAGSRWKRVRW